MTLDPTPSAISSQEYVEKILADANNTIEKFSRPIETSGQAVAKNFRLQELVKAVFGENLIERYIYDSPCRTSTITQFEDEFDGSYFCENSDLVWELRGSHGFFSELVYRVADYAIEEPEKYMRPILKMDVVSAIVGIGFVIDGYRKGVKTSEGLASTAGGLAILGHTIYSVIRDKVKQRAFETISQVFNDNIASITVAELSLASGLFTYRMKKENNIFAKAAQIGTGIALFAHSSHSIYTQGYVGAFASSIGNISRSYPRLVPAICSLEIGVGISLLEHAERKPHNSPEKIVSRAFGIAILYHSGHLFGGMLKGSVQKIVSVVQSSILSRVIAETGAGVGLIAYGYKQGLGTKTGSLSALNGSLLLLHSGYTIFKG